MSHFLSDMWSADSKKRAQERVDHSMAARPSTTPCTPCRFTNTARAARRTMGRRQYPSMDIVRVRPRWTGGLTLLPCMAAGRCSLLDCIKFTIVHMPMQPSKPNPYMYPKWSLPDWEVGGVYKCSDGFERVDGERSW
jgi:hypothetical protein